MNPNKIYIIDIETNTLLSEMLDYRSLPYKLREDAKLWCVVIRRLGDNAVFHQSLEGITKEWIKETLSDCEILVAHNGVKFDFISLKLFGVLDYEIGHLGREDLLFGKPCKFIDTLILSRLLNPDRYLGHSLEVWGERLGEPKTDYRGALIEAGLLDKDAPKSAEFSFYNQIMLDYCIQDTNVNAKVFSALIKEIGGYSGWKQAIKIEHKLADYGIRRETLGFFFDKEKAIACVEELQKFIADIKAKVDPLLPPRKLSDNQLKEYTLPKNQIKADGTISKACYRKLAELGAMPFYDKNCWKIVYGDEEYSLPYDLPLKTHVPGKIEDLDHVKSYLIELGWQPTEWRERDVTKDTKKKTLSLEKQEEVVARYVKQTLEKGLYKKERLEILEVSEYDLEEHLLTQIGGKKPVRVPTSPSVRVGVDKELCPSLVELGEKVAFAKDFSLYLTYRHRLSSIAGGDIEDMDFNVEEPNTGFLSVYREEDGRVPTPAIEVGSNTHRYRHIKICNISRVTSLYGEQMRSLFGCGEGFLQLAFDFSSLELRVQAGFIRDYPQGAEVGKSLVAEKPNDVHTVNSIKMGIPRSDSKSVGYALLYGAAPPKISKMLKVSLDRGKEVSESYWDAMLPLKMFKQDLELEWEKNGKEYIIGIDGRKLRTRSRHSLLNVIFQSTGVICAKYVAVFLMEELERQGLGVDPFVAKPDVCSMIEYHDEQQLAVNPKLIKFKMFETKEEAEEFIAKWEGSQLSALGHGKKYYVALPNQVSSAILKACKRVEELLELKFELGIEWMVGRNWAECH